MKAIINGVTVEGTPQEIMEYQRLHAERAQMKPVYPHQTTWPPISPSTKDDGSILGIAKITSGTTAKRCEGPCYCTGACMGEAHNISEFSPFLKQYVSYWESK